MAQTGITTMTMENFSETMTLLSSQLDKDGLKPQEIRSIQLLAEETFHRLKKGMDAGDDFSLDISLHKTWGNTELHLTAYGSEYNPIPAVTDQVTTGEALGSGTYEDEDVFRFIILKANNDRMRYVRKSNANLVIIRVRDADSSRKQLWFTVGGMALGVLCGMLMRRFLDAQTLASINNGIITPTRNIFLNAIHMMMGPVTFLRSSRELPIYRMLPLSASSAAG